MLKEILLTALTSVTTGIAIGKSQIAFFLYNRIATAHKRENKGERKKKFAKIT